MENELLEALNNVDDDKTRNIIMSYITELNNEIKELYNALYEGKP